MITGVIESKRRVITGVITGVIESIKKKRRINKNVDEKVMKTGVEKLQNWCNFNKKTRKNETIE